MDRGRKAEPYSNETLWTREVSKNLANHQSRLHHAQPWIDTSTPKLSTNPIISKKSQLKEERLDSIENENRRLLDRIATIAMSTTREQQELHQWKTQHKVKKSLHAGFWRKEQEKIWRENQVNIYFARFNLINLIIKLSLISVILSKRHC